MNPTQLELFGRQQPPAARRTDPTTSHLAAAEHERTGRRSGNTQRVAEVVASFPGLTAIELHDLGRTEMDRHEWSRRLPDAERLGLVRRGRARECRVSGHQSMTWWPPVE